MNTPQVGLEPTANRLTADCSTTELLRISKLVTCYHSFSIITNNFIKKVFNKII